MPCKFFSTLSLGLDEGIEKGGKSGAHTLT